MDGEKRRVPIGNIHGTIPPTLCVQMGRRGQSRWRAGKKRRKAIRLVPATVPSTVPSTRRVVSRSTAPLGLATRVALKNSRARSCRCCTSVRDHPTNSRRPSEFARHRSNGEQGPLSRGARGGIQPRLFSAARACLTVYALEQLFPPLRFIVNIKIVKRARFDAR